MSRIIYQLYSFPFFSRAFFFTKNQENDIECPRLEYPVIPSFGPITNVFLAVSLPTVKTATDHRHRRLGTLLALKVALHYNTGNALAISIRGQKYGAGNKSAGLAEEKVSDRFISLSLIHI